MAAKPFADTTSTSKLPGRVFILLPAYNEESALRRLIPAISAAMTPADLDWKIVVVDDGSSDGTSTLDAVFPADIPVHVLRHPTNRGYGAALATGYDWILKNADADDVVLSLDADNTHPASEIPTLIEKINEGFDVVTASYRMPGGKAVGVPFNRQVFSAGVNFLLRLRFGIVGARTYSNGFRAYRIAALVQAQKVHSPLIKETGFAGGTELFIKVCREGARVAEIPSELHYENRGTGSKIQFGQTIRGYLRLLMDV